MTFLKLCTLFALVVLVSGKAQSQTIKTSPVAAGWARNQINAVIFRKNSLVSHGDTQYIAFYDDTSSVSLGKRKLGTNKWTIHKTNYVGDTRDAHKSISIAVDGAGYLHLVWNQHDSKLQYCQSTSAGSLDLTKELPMLSDKENRVTYPEFYNLPNGGLLFLYRDGRSGRGNLVLNRYDVKSHRWSRLQDSLIDGENQRSAYWQAAVDPRGGIHVSWVWRDTPDVASNHDICYAKSLDGGKTWLKSSGEKYKLPITAASAEYVIHIPPNSELINQTSMAVDTGGQPYIVSYWRPAGSQVPQFQIVYQDGSSWRISQVTQRRLGFSLSGMGTRRIPISRPQVLVRNSTVLVVFRDIERGNRISLAVSTNLRSDVWTISDLNSESVGMWEPTYDPMVWKRKMELHLFVQSVGQGDAEGLEDVPPQMISVLEWRLIH